MGVGVGVGVGEDAGMVGWLNEDPMWVGWIRIG